MRPIAVQRAADRLHSAPGGRRCSGRAVCRKAGISIQTYYRWRKKYGGLMPSLKLLERMLLVGALRTDQGATFYRLTHPSRAQYHDYSFGLPIQG